MVPPTTDAVLSNSITVAFQSCMRFWLKDKLRLIWAGLILWGGMTICVLLGSVVFPAKAPSGLIGVGAATVFLVLLGTIYKLFNSSKSLEAQTQARIDELEQKGLLEVTSFRANRAFQVQEIDGEGINYFIELENGAVLFLSGQYLYDYEPIDDYDPEISQPRQFPCTGFIVKRHRQTGVFVDLLCAGGVLEPELLAPPFSKYDFRENRVPEDGQIITDRTYDAIKQERLHQR